MGPGQPAPQACSLAADLPCRLLLLPQTLPLAWPLLFSCLPFLPSALRVQPLLLHCLRCWLLHALTGWLMQSSVTLGTAGHYQCVGASVWLDGQPRSILPRMPSVCMQADPPAMRQSSRARSWCRPLAIVGCL